VGEGSTDAYVAARLLWKMCNLMFKSGGDEKEFDYVVTLRYGSFKNNQSHQQFFTFLFQQPVLPTMLQ